MKRNKYERRERNKTLVVDDRWKRKGHAHGVSHPSPKPCPDCKGIGHNEMGIECFSCCGEGEIYG